MKRLTTIEFWGFLLGIIFLVSGVAMIIWPQTGVVFHPANDAIGMPQSSEPEMVSPVKSRAYGVLAVVLGAGIAAAAFYREKSER
jgi:hypothetical protein